MGIIELLLFAVGLSMDACAVSICKGLSMKQATLKEGAICGAWFGGFQALMPLLGFFLGSLFAEAIETIDHWIAFVLLAFIGINMLREAFSKCEECEENGGADLSFKTMLVMAVATSIDALAVGACMALGNIGGPHLNLPVAVCIIGGITFAAALVSFHSARLLHHLPTRWLETVAGLLLLLAHRRPQTTTPNFFAKQSALLANRTFKPFRLSAT